MINITHLVAHQEESEASKLHDNNFSVPKSAKIMPQNFGDSSTKTVNLKVEPDLFASEVREFGDLDLVSIFAKYYYWLWIRKHNSFDQQVSNFSGWNLKHCSHNELKKTVITYLPPINSKVTDFSTIFAYFDYLLKLAADVNMPYVNITLDIGAAVNAYKALWSQPSQYENIVIHLGDFHFMKENFKVRISIDHSHSTMFSVLLNFF